MSFQGQKSCTMRNYPDQFSWPRIELPPGYLATLFIRESKNKQTNKKWKKSYAWYLLTDRRAWRAATDSRTRALCLFHCYIPNDWIEWRWPILIAGKILCLIIYRYPLDTSKLLFVFNTLTSRIKCWRRCFIVLCSI